MSTLPSRLTALVEKARLANPDIHVQDEVFTAFLDQRLVAGNLDDDAAERNAGDLLLACAVLAGDSRAIAEFELRFVTPMGGILARIVGTSLADDVKQRLREVLVVGGPGNDARIASYAGRGPLRAWVRAVAVRLALRARSEEASIDPPALEDLISDDDPVLQVLLHRYRGEFRAAFEAALAGLKTRDRTLLRQHFVDGVGTEKLAALHQVHRVTMFRRLAKIQHQLLAATRRNLGARIAVNHNELDSIMRAVKDNVEVTLERVLASNL